MNQNNIMLYEAFLKRSEFDLKSEKYKKNAISGYSRNTGRDFPIMANQLVHLMCKIFDDAIIANIAMKTGHISLDEAVYFLTTGSSLKKGEKERSLMSYVFDTVSYHDRNEIKDALNKVSTIITSGNWEDLEDRSKDRVGVCFTKVGQAYEDTYGMYLDFELKSTNDEHKILDRDSANSATANVYMDYKGERYTLYDGNDPLYMDKFDTTSFSDIKHPFRDTRKGKLNRKVADSYHNILMSMINTLSKVEIDELNDIYEMVNAKIKNKFDREERYEKRLSDFRGIVEGEYENTIEMIEDIEDEMMDLYESDPDKFTKLSKEEYDDMRKTMKVFSLGEYEENIRSNKKKIKNDEDFVLFDFKDLFIEKILNEEDLGNDGTAGYGYGYDSYHKQDILIADITNKKYYAVLDYHYTVSHEGNRWNGD